MGLAVLAAGCSHAPAGGTVTGAVYLDGQPLAGAVIRLWPKDDLRLGVYGGRTDEMGRIELMPRDGQGVKPGKYLVLVAKADPRKGAGLDPRTEEQRQILGGPEGFRNLLPERYSDKARCPFLVEIKEGANELPPLELTSRPGA